MDNETGQVQGDYATVADAVHAAPGLGGVENQPGVSAVMQQNPPGIADQPSGIRTDITTNPGLHPGMAYHPGYAAPTASGDIDAILPMDQSGQQVQGITVNPTDNLPAQGSDLFSLRRRALGSDHLPGERSIRSKINAHPGKGSRR